MEEIAIQTIDLTKNFKDLIAVDHVSIDVKKGEIFGLLGPNGAGKTTLIRMLCTLATPSEGTAIVGGYDLKHDEDKIRENIGLVSEKMIMYDMLTPRENLKLFGKLYNIPKKKLKAKIDELLKLVKMDKWGDKLINTFSTGMKQRINVIRALLNDPHILFLDEPTLGLDPQSTSELRAFIKEINLKNNTTIVLTTHMMVEADLLCDRIAIIDYGKIIGLDTSQNLKRMVVGADVLVMELEVANLNNEMVSLLQKLEVVQQLTRISDTKVRIQTKGDDAFDNIIDVIRKANGKITYIKDLEPTLEDVFLHMTGHEVRDELNDSHSSSAGPFHRRRANRVR
ncbi:MAG: ABC transporter ATP-binding protein [Promethearchaeota archaeon]